MKYQRSVAFTEHQEGSPSRHEETSFVNTTPRVKQGPTVTSFQNTSLDEMESNRYRKAFYVDTSQTEEHESGAQTRELDSSAFLSESTG